MLKKLASGMMVGMIVLAMAAPGMSFANTEGEVAPDYNNPFRGEKVAVERTPEERREHRLAFIAEWAPDLLDDFTALLADHDAVHEQLEATKEAGKVAKEAVRLQETEERKAYVEQLRQDINDGIITQEDAADLFDAFIADQKAQHDTWKAQFEIHKAEFEMIKEDLLANKDAREAKRAELRVAVEEENGDLIASILAEILVLDKAHVALDYDKLAVSQTHLAYVESLLQ